jgi:hypothetical protein
MKFTDILNERYLTPEQQKEEKRAKTIFKALKKGVVKVPHPRLDEVITFRYHINDNVFYKWETYMGKEYVIILTNNLTGEGMTIYTDNEKIVDACTTDIESISRNPIGVHLREMIILKIKIKFENFRVPIHIQTNGMKFELDEPEQPITEGLDHQNVDSPDLNEEQLKQLKRAKTIFKAFKKGKVDAGEHVIAYEIEDPYYYWNHSDREKTIRVEFNNIKVHITDPILYQECMNNTEKRWRNSARGIIEDTLIKPHIRNKFKNFRLDVGNIDYFKYVLDEPQPLNEGYMDDIITDKERKKAKIVYDAFKNGTFTIGGYTKVRYELHNGYDLMMGDYGARIIKFKDELFPKKRFMSAYLIHDDGHETYIDISKGNTVYRAVLIRLSERFQQFNFHITY